MKKILFSLLTAAIVFFGAVACSDGGSSSNSETSNNSENSTVDQSLPAVQDGYIRINCAQNNASDLWIWDDFDQSEIDKCSNWGSTAISITGTNGSFKYADIKLASNPVTIHFIVRSEPNDEGKLTGNCEFLFPSKYNEIFVSTSGSVFIDKEMTKQASGLVSAKISSEQIISITLGGNAKASKENISVKNGSQSLTVSAVSSDKIIVGENLKELGLVTVVYTDENGIDSRTATPEDSLLDQWYALESIDDLGYNATTGVFTTWAPLATNVSVLLFADASAVSSGTLSGTPIAMTHDNDGTWKTTDVRASVGSNKYYKYRITNRGETYDVCDIWAKVASKDSKATQIVSIDDASAKPSNWETVYTNPFGTSQSEEKKYTDAIIYEMHITDWSQALRSSVVADKPGTFAEITSGLAEGGKLREHLQDLGVTHVQILPMFEYAVTTKRTASGAVEENDNAYNWGYNPYNWNTPESRYASLKDSSDGTDAVKAMREMIKAFHDAGFAVIMDVVYNHTSGTGSGSIYDMTVPQYFYRMNGSTYSNGSGCGNEVATNHTMVKNYVIDSLKHWMNDYHINGFRFDLMGLHETSTMADIYDALHKIDKNVIVYGEPWTGGDSLVVGGVSTSNIKDATSSSHTTDNGTGCFDDSYRNAIKGGEFGGFAFGEIQGEFSENILTGLIGSPEKTGVIGRYLNYAECHDNQTLFDKLSSSLTSSVKGTNDETATNAWKAYDSMTDDEKNLVRSEDKLAAAFVILAQGTPFLNGGQEFMRTKQGDPDSYAADKKGGKFWENIDEVNAIDLTFKTKFADVYNTYKGLIALRKANSSAFGANTSAKAERISDGVTKYTTGDFLIYFNATNSEANIATSGYTKLIDVTSGSPAESTSLPATVGAKSFVILKK